MSGGKIAYIWNNKLKILIFNTLAVRLRTNIISGTPSRKNKCLDQGNKSRMKNEAAWFYVVC